MSLLKNAHHKSRKVKRRGSVLIEATAALGILSVVALMLLKGTISILAPRQWTLVQNVSDSYLTYEKAYAQRIDFEDLTGATSPWPIYPAKDESECRHKTDSHCETVPAQRSIGWIEVVPGRTRANKQHSDAVNLCK